MTVMQSVITRPRPGRRHDAVALAVEAAKLLERHGSAQNRLLTAQMAGEMSGTHVFTTEFENGEVWGEFTDSLYSDAELQTLLDQVERPDSPVDMIAMSIVTEIPLGRNGPTRHGAVVEAYISRVIPGRFDGAVGLANTVFDFVEGQGATNCRLSQMTSAGTMTDCLVASWELENMRALGRLGDSYLNQPEGQQIMETLTAANGPVTPVSSGIYAEIPL
jgi:hypothetical protein